MQTSNFPTWRYHAEHEPRIFETFEELEEAGEGWVESPALIGVEPKRKPGRPKKVEP